MVFVLVGVRKINRKNFFYNFSLKRKTFKEKKKRMKMKRMRKLFFQFFQIKRTVEGIGFFKV